MVLRGFLVAARWVLALVSVVVLGAASIWFTESISPAGMTGWERLHFTLPVLMALGCIAAGASMVPGISRAAFYFCLAATGVVFLIAASFLSVANESFQEFLSIFVCLPAALAIIDASAWFRRDGQ